jgi:AraC-like DNA-binding protein
MPEHLYFMFKRIDSCLDALTQVLDAAHLGGRLSARISVQAPWGLRFGYVERLAGFHVVTQGQCWLQADGLAAPVRLCEGDVVLLPHGAAHVLADDLASPVVDLHPIVARIAPGQTIPLPQGDGSSTTLLCGSYSFSLDGGNPLFRGLPALIHLTAEQVRSTTLGATVQMLLAEAAHEVAGSALVVDRLVDLLFVHALRAWLTLQADGGPHSWFGALADPMVGPVLQAVHADPSHAWTVESLAQRSGLSRAPFTRRFREAVGEPPLAYVTRWRMSIAADLLEKGERAAQVAGQVGYENEFAFAKAFKRIRGIAPGEHRRRYTRT